MVARIQPEWLERLAGHLVTGTYSDPHWDDETARVVGFEHVFLHDLPIVEKRPVHSIMTCTRPCPCTAGYGGLAGRLDASSAHVLVPHGATTAADDNWKCPFSIPNW